MNVLAQLQERSKSSANPANRANLAPVTAVDSHDSRDSQGEIPLRDFLSLRRLRMRLLYLSEDFHLEAVHVHRLPDEDVQACAGLGDAELVAYLLRLTDDAEQKARAPITTPILACGDCRHFTPDHTNPLTGLGYCSAGKGAYYPMKRHRCPIASAIH
ncbi:hypothetical protein PY254_11470 [Rhodanobacter sp. AS-Z3]|uniref:hypothetical protein n=1 Tax=Rhodanobacter sp. AS-Z3 TaxID=3031330 RepID=UPI00247840D0|nr:hypothetical protein [Rhodanobacter sp. AS-Z3]WEN13862.1 hypothetical protein PY254_11470 [Rhodanobacter sp. AS-Z3]